MLGAVAFVIVLTVQTVASTECSSAVDGACLKTTGTPDRFQDKVFLVTGASSGIGEVVAKHLAADGAHVVLAARRIEKLEQVRDSINASGGLASTVRLDVMDHEMVEKVMKGIVEQHGRLDGAFNNAGGGGNTGTVADLPVEDFRKDFDLNFFGTYHCIKAEMMVMMKQGFGSIVNNLSILARSVLAQQHAYMASKRALLSIQESAALEGAPFGVRVNSVSPGFTRPSEALDTFLEKNPGMEELFKNPQGRMVDASEVYNAVAFLFDENLSKSVVGIDMPIAGGHNIPTVSLR